MPISENNIRLKDCLEIFQQGPRENFDPLMFFSFFFLILFFLISASITRTICNEQFLVTVFLQNFLRFDKNI